MKTEHYGCVGSGFIAVHGSTLKVNSHEEEVGMKMHVSNLADEITEDDLKKAFQDFGQVSSVSIVKDSFGESRGFGFVEMPDKTEALSAVNGLKSLEVKGRVLVVEEAR
jgi:RNA recognition motif-containing protein